RRRPVASDLDPVEVVAVEHIVRPAAAAEDVAQQLRQRPGGYVDGRDEVQPELEAGLPRDADRPRARVRVRVGLRDEREGGAAEALDVERRLEPAEAAADERNGLGDEGEIAGPPAVAAAPEAGDPPEQLGVESEPRP